MGKMLSKSSLEVDKSEVISYDPSESYAMSCNPIFDDENRKIAKRDDAVKVISALEETG